MILVEKFYRYIVDCVLKLSLQLYKFSKLITKQWNIDEPAPKWNQVIEPISFGFKFNTEEYNRTLDKGPIANLPQVSPYLELFIGESLLLNFYFKV